MGKSSRTRREAKTQSHFATPRVSRPPITLRAGFSPLRETFQPLFTEDEDRRRYHPMLDAPPRALGRAGTPRLVIRQPKPNAPGYSRRNSRTIPSQVMFDAPSKVLICVRRHIRKRVILAQGGTGSGRRLPRFNHYSQVGC